MATHLTKGKEGEDLAAEYLDRHGYQIRFRNWRSGHHEIDIIATRDGVIHFIEVKTRHSLIFGYPEEGVTRKKFLHLKKAAAHFLASSPGAKKIRFDILSILRLRDRPVEFYLIEDVYL